jgi:hypothetical protein
MFKLQPGHQSDLWPGIVKNYIIPFKYNCDVQVKLEHTFSIIIIIIIIFSGSATQRGQWPPCSRGFVISHDTT